MNNKNLIITILAVIIIAGLLYFGYVKFMVKKANDNVIEEAEKEAEAAVIVEKKKETLVESLDEAGKKDAYYLAEVINSDITGWNYHEMELYDLLAKSSDAYFFYFVTVAWPDTAKTQLKKSLQDQKWKSLTAKSKKAGWDETKANKLITSIIYRIQNFNL